MSDSQESPWVLARNLSATAFKGEALSLFDLYRETLRGGQTVIEGRTFTDCRLEGPAVIAVLSGVHFDSTDFGYTGGDIGRIVWRSASATGVVGPSRSRTAPSRAARSSRPASRVPRRSCSRSWPCR